MDATHIILILSLVALGALAFYFQRQLRDKTAALTEIAAKHEAMIDRYRLVENVEQEARDVKRRLENERQSLQEQINVATRDLDSLKKIYLEKKFVYDTLSERVKLLEEDVELFDFGVYKPLFVFDDSDSYKAALLKKKAAQKEMIKAKTACVCGTEWTVGGSKAEGRKMTNQQIRLMLRAFNGECDAACMKVRWNNVDKMEERVRKAFEAINMLGESSQITIARTYRELKLDEIRLVHEHQQKKQEEKEEQRRIKEEMREEARAQKEAEAAAKDAEKNERIFQEALEKARRELAEAAVEAKSEVEQRVRQLEEQLQEALSKKRKAISLAQLTKFGHVYIISNVGSFGQNVYKIGLTRRFEPMDRVKELGDASVPFRFDVHAMVFSEDAPTLEKKLHDKFNARRVNLVNNRKEFFHVELREIEDAAKDFGVKVEFTRLAEAREYRESLAIRRQAETVEQKAHDRANEFPAAL